MTRVPTPCTQEAVRIVATQLGCDEDEAFTRLRERADALPYRLHTYAEMVIDGIILFDP
jgi:AmiR/NasT family two-component response regulator